MAQSVKSLPAMWETCVQSLGQGDSSCLENSMDRGAWWATVQGGHKESDTTEGLTHTIVANVF